MTSVTLGAIGAAFQDEGFAPSPDSHYDDSSERRTLTQAYLESVDWTDGEHVRRALRVFERLMRGHEPQYTQPLINALRRDGYIYDADIGHIAELGPRFPAGALSNLKDLSAIREQLERVQRAAVDDPALAIGSAKELIESTAKVVLAERGQPPGDKADLPVLIKDAQKALGVHRSVVAPGPDSSEAVSRILGGVSNIAVGLAELRNLGYGTGHGPGTG